MTRTATGTAAAHGMNGIKKMNGYPGLTENGIKELCDPAWPLWSRLQLARATLSAERGVSTVDVSFDEASALVASIDGPRAMGANRISHLFDGDGSN
jgi:hypothetical protein